MANDRAGEDAWRAGREMGAEASHGAAAGADDGADAAGERPVVAAPVNLATAEEARESSKRGGESVADQAVGLVRRYLGEQVASQLIRAHEDVSGHVRHQVHSAKARAKASVRDNISLIQERASQAQEKARRKLFAKLFEADTGHGGATEGTEVDAAASEPGPSRFWLERSASWVDSMQPQGRNWYALALPTSLLGSDADLSFAYDENLRLDEELEHQIQLDLPRTFPSVDLFQDPSVLASFERTLRAAAVTCPEVGYVQGMNFLAGYLVIHCNQEQLAGRLAIELLTNPLYNMRGVFEEGLRTLHRISSTLRNVLGSLDNELASHLDAVGFDEYFFSFQWSSTLFAYSMPFDALQYVWDLFFEFGWPAFFAVCTVLLADRRGELLAAPDFDDVYALLKECVANPRVDFASRARAVLSEPRFVQLGPSISAVTRED